MYRLTDSPVGVVFVKIAIYHLSVLWRSLPLEECIPGQELTPELHHCCDFASYSPQMIGILQNQAFRGTVSHLYYSGCSPEYADALQNDLVFQLEYTAPYTGLYHAE